MFCRAIRDFGVQNPMLITTVDIVAQMLEIVYADIGHVQSVDMAYTIY